MDGVLIVRKEKGYTSHDVVAKLRGILHMKKIGSRRSTSSCSGQSHQAGRTSHGKRKNL